MVISMPELTAPAAAAWQRIQQQLRARYGEATYRSWFAKMHLQPSEGFQVNFAVPTRFIREWIITNYLDTMKRLWQQENETIVSIQLVVDADFCTEMSAQATPMLEPEVLQHSGQSEPVSSSLSMTLDPRFTFDSFVVGNSNALAQAAARSVAEADKIIPQCNPLFIYSSVGLGKTHLMHAIAAHAAEHQPKRRIMYISAERFMYEFVKALRNKSIMSFKEQFRSVDLLMIDDIQFMCGKDSTQEEFFHTFNALIDNHCQVVISCDRSPSDLDGIEERIRSRLGWGLVADIQSTDYALRLGILRAKVAQMQVEVPTEVLEFLAERITSNVRELEGALNKVVAHTRLLGGQFSLATTEQILRDLLRAHERTVTIEHIQKRVSEHYNIRIADMSSNRRLRAVARPRQVAMYLAKTLTPRSLSEIGKKFGGKDHTTVMYAIKKVEELASLDRELSEDIKRLGQMLQAS
jgi:chromosomal replication initiator protein